MNDGQQNVNDIEQIIRGIDHIIVMSGNLDRSDQWWRSVGFESSARGFHDTGGTANHLIILDRAYIELLGLVGQAQSPHRAIMTDTPGMWGLALRGHADATFAFWTSLGLEPSEPVSLSRPVEIDGRIERAKFRLTMLARAPGLPFPLFCCEHLTPELVWGAQPSAHQNGATSLRAVTVVLKDEHTRHQLERVLGRDSVRALSLSSIEVGECRLELLRESDFVGRFGVSGSAPLTPKTPIAALTIATADLHSARASAERAGAQVLCGTDGRFFTAIATEGILLEWVRHAA